MVVLSALDAGRDPALPRYLSERLAEGEAVVALHGPPAISSVLIELGLGADDGLRSPLARALQVANVPYLEVAPGARKEQARAARAGCLALVGVPRLLEAEARQRVGPSLEGILGGFAPQSAVEIVITEERLLSQPGLEALCLSRAELEALVSGSRDPAPLLAMQALDQGARSVRIGSPRSLQRGTATRVTQGRDEA